MLLARIQLFVHRDLQVLWRYSPAVQGKLISGAEFYIFSPVGFHEDPVGSTFQPV